MAFLLMGPVDFRVGASSNRTDLEGTSRGGSGNRNDSSNMQKSNGESEIVALVIPDTWGTVHGVVSLADHDVIAQTAEGEVVVGLGQASYREAVSFTIGTGDEVVVSGYGRRW